MLRTWGAAAVVVLGVAGCGSHSAPRPQSPRPVIARSGPLALLRVKSGVLLDDAFRRPVAGPVLMSTYEFNGSAPPAHRRFRADARGLHIGVARHAPGKFEGSFAVTHAAYPVDAVFHTRMSRPAAKAVASPKRSGEAVFAVQTGSTKKTGVINYVVVATFTSAGLFHELIGYAHGRYAGATTEVLWESPYAARRPATLDIALRTDGRHTLEVWINGRRSFASSSLHMDIAPPFQPYLEVQGLQIPYESTFQDFWVAGSDSLTVEGLAAGARLTLTRDEGPPVVSRAGADGTATLRLGVDRARGRGTLRIAGKKDALGPFDFAGGDVLRVES